MNYTYKKNLILAFVASFLVTFGGCTNGFDEINTDPNNPAETSTGFLLTAAQKVAMDYTWDEWFNGRRGNQLAQYWASNQYSSESRYQYRESISNTYWRVFYANVMSDLQHIIDLNTAEPEKYEGFGHNDNQIAVALIMKVWVAQNITDCWGPIPYTNALQGPSSPKPAYDSQEVAYNAMIADLANARSLIKTDADGPQGDVIYGGNMDNWNKFCNSLTLRVGMRMADANNDAAKAAVETAIAGGVFTSNADNALFTYGEGAPNNNPLNEDYKTRNDFAASDVMVNLLIDLNDTTRMKAFYAPTFNSVENDTSIFVGEVYGLTEADAAITTNDEVSQRSAMILAADFPGIFMDYAQVEFLLAEAAERGYAGSGSAAAHYEAGITASFDFWGASGAAEYIAQDDVAYASAPGTWREKIGKQKWIALYMQGIQGWAEWRRLDFGVLKLPDDENPEFTTIQGESIPNRMIYPLDEQTLNEASYTDAVTNLLGGPDNLDTKLWWDVN